MTTRKCCEQETRSEVQLFRMDISLCTIQVRTEGYDQRRHCTFLCSTKPSTDGADDVARAHVRLLVDGAADKESELPYTSAS